MALVCCRECGREVSDKAKFCPQCGYVFKIKGRGFAITSMVLGIISCTNSLPVFMITLSLLLQQNGLFAQENLVATTFISGCVLLLSALSLIFGILSAGRGSRLKKTAAGITLGSVSTVICLICLIINIINLV